MELLPLALVIRFGNADHRLELRRAGKVTVGQMRVFAVVALCALSTSVTAFSPTFTGNVPTDFPATSPGVFVATGGTHRVPWTGSPNNESGWELIDVRYGYQFSLNSAYFGACPRCCSAHIANKVLLRLRGILTPAGRERGCGSSHRQESRGDWSSPLSGSAGSLSSWGSVTPCNANRAQVSIPAAASPAMLIVMEIPTTRVPDWRRRAVWTNQTSTWAST